MLHDDTKALLAAIADAAHDLDGLESGQLLAKAAVCIAEQAQEIRRLATYETVLNAAIDSGNVLEVQLLAANDRANNAEQAAKQWEAVAKLNRQTVEHLYQVGSWAIAYVGSANYHDREIEAKRRLSEAYEGQPIESEPPMLGYVP